MIGASELIITPDGCIYHLNLHPDELAPVVITVGDPARVAEVSKHFDRIEHKKEHREFVTHTGYIGSKRMSVVSTGIGPDNIDIVLNELDALVNIDFNTRLPKSKIQSLQIIRLGTSGSLQEDVPVDSLVATSFAIGLDNLMHYYRPAPNAEELFLLHEFEKHTRLDGHPIRPYIAEGAISLRNHFVEGYTQGLTVTCPGFYASQGRILRLPLALPQLIDDLAGFRAGAYRITNFEMETSAIYGLGKLMGHHCLSISTIVANRQLQTFSGDAGKAVAHMISRSLEILSAL